VEAQESRVKRDSIATSGDVQDHSLAPAKDSGLLQYWPTLLAYKRTILITTLIATVLSAISAYRTIPIYEAAGRIALNRDPDILGFRKNSDAVSEDVDYDLATALDTQVKVLQSDKLALAAIRNLQLFREPAFAGSPRPDTDPGALEPSDESALLGSFHGAMRVSVVPHTRIIELRFASSDPKLAAKAVNTVISAYIEENYHNRFESTMETTNWLGKQLADLQLKVETSQEKLIQYQKEHQIIGDEKQNTTLAKLDELNRQLASVQGERIWKESRYRALESTSPEFLADAATAASAAKLHDQEDSIKAQIDLLSAQYGESHPKMIELNQQLRSIRRMLDEEDARAAEKIKSEYVSALQHEKLLQAAFENQKREANRLNESSIEYALLKRDADSNRQLYENLQQKLKEAGISAGIKSSSVEVVDLARVPLAPSYPNRSHSIMVGLFAGLIAGILLAFVLDAINNTVRTPEQISELAGLAVLGIIPSSTKPAGFYGRRKSRLSLANSAPDESMVIALNHPQSGIAESYRALRTSILLSSPGGPPRILMVTSPLPREGKTMTSVNTAVALVQKGARVLVIDGDLRRPMIHTCFRLPAERGLSTILTGASDLDSTEVAVSEIANLHVLPAGPLPPNPAELLGSSAMERLLRQCQQKFDHIIIDTPPVLSVTDAVALSTQVDSVLLVVHSSKTTKSALRQACDLLQHVHARVMGCVMNAVDVDSLHSYYHSYYYYGAERSGYDLYHAQGETLETAEAKLAE
jgi:capsular exopolysaccharide synthesis family protein